MRLAIGAALALAPLPAAADPLQQQVVAAMRATDTRDVAFSRTTRAERTGSSGKTYVTRYDPRASPRFGLVSVDGKPPSADERKQAAKEADPARGYAKLADWFGSPATRSDAGNGRVLYRFARLPAGTFKLGSHDASADTSAEALVETAGGRPWVHRVRFVSAKPIRMMLVAKVERIVADSQYRQLPDGRAFPETVNVDMTGSMMGKAGSMTTRTRWETR